MKPHPRVLSPLMEYRLSVWLPIWLCAAVCAGSPSSASAQQPVAPDGKEKYAYPVDVRAYACVDPSDPTTRRWFQAEPCKLPMFHLPLPGAPYFEEQPRWPAYPPRSRAMQGDHAMFWRFPVQGMGPHEVPRHSWR